MGIFRTFNDFWEGLSESSKIRMNKADVEFGYMASSLNIKQARLQGRRDALRDLWQEFDMHDMFKERDQVRAFYRSDVSFNEE
jgi:hypothetical protein